MAVRLKDVAERAGVSIKTASNVINDHPHIKASTRERVERAIRELRYRPNLSARQLKHGRSGFLALALPFLNQPYFGELAARLNQQVTAQHRVALMDITEGSREAEELVLEGMRTHIIDGAIFSPFALEDVDFSERTDDLPMVLLGERAMPAAYDHIAVDSVAASEAMTRHLLDLGRTRVAAIGRESFRGTNSVRLEGYRQALAAAGRPQVPELEVAVSGFTREQGRVTMHELLARPTPPDAVFCFNDELAIGAVRACQEAGVRIPDDVAIAGFDDIPETRYSTPTVTTVSPDLDFLAREAIRLLLDRIADPARPPERVLVPWRLELRESTTARGSTS